MSRQTPIAIPWSWAYGESPATLAVPSVTGASLAFVRRRCQNLGWCIQAGYYPNTLLIVHDGEFYPCQS